MERVRLLNGIAYEEDGGGGGDDDDNNKQTNQSRDESGGNVTLKRSLNRLCDVTRQVALPLPDGVACVPLKVAGRLRRLAAGSIPVTRERRSISPPDRLSHPRIDPESPRLILKRKKSLAPFVKFESRAPEREKRRAAPFKVCLRFETSGSSTKRVAQ